MCLGLILEQKYEFGTRSLAKIQMLAKLFSKHMNVVIFFHQEIPCEYFHQKHKYW